MEGFPSNPLLIWHFYPQIAAILLGLGVLYFLGWRRLRRRGLRRLASGLRLASFLGGLLFLAIAMMSAADVLHDYLLTAHMVQHMLITMFGPPLIMMAEPFSILVAGLPFRARRSVSRLLLPGSRNRRVVTILTNPWLSWVLAIGTLWFWHIPGPYQLALDSGLVHILEHLTLFVPSLLFWGHVVGAKPHLHGPLSYGFRISYNVAAMAQNEAFGVLFTLARTPFYPHYLDVPRLWGLSALDDQVLAGSLMWSMGGMMYVMAILALLGAMLTQEEKLAAV